VLSISQSANIGKSLYSNISETSMLLSDGAVLLTSFTGTVSLVYPLQLINMSKTIGYGFFAN